MIKPTTVLAACAAAAVAIMPFTSLTLAEPLPPAPSPVPPDHPVWAPLVYPFTGGPDGQGGTGYGRCRPTRGGADNAPGGRLP